MIENVSSVLELDKENINITATIIYSQLLLEKQMDLEVRLS